MWSPSSRSSASASGFSAAEPLPDPVCLPIAPAGVERHRRLLERGQRRGAGPDRGTSPPSPARPAPAAGIVAAAIALSFSATLGFSSSPAPGAPLLAARTTEPGTQAAGTTSRAGGPPPQASAPGPPALAVTADTARITVGDPVTLELQIPARAVEGEVTVGLAEPRPEGLRVLSSEVVPGEDGAGSTARLRIALFRPGRHELPALELVHRRSPDAAPDTLRAPAPAIEVVPVLPPGEQALRDIKDLEPLPARSRLPLWLVLAAALALCAAWVLHRRRRGRGAAAPLASRPPDARSAYQLALDRLAEVERARWPARGRLDLHYEAVADALRRYLEEAEGVPAPERTTPELVSTLPPFLAGDGLREASIDLLEEADLVKFARFRPEPGSAAGLLQRARALLDRWHAAGEAERAARTARAAEVGAAAGEAEAGSRSTTPTGT
jgi:hypothetical protein